MFNFPRFFKYLLRIFIGIVLAFIVFYILSTSAIKTNKEPIIARCPTEANAPSAIGVDADSKIIAADLDVQGTAEITSRDITLNTASSVQADVGMPFTATLVIYDSTPSGTYNAEITFRNDDDPQQTESCQVNIIVTNTQTSANSPTYVSLHNPDEQAPQEKPQPKSFERKLLGVVPGILLLGMAWFLYSRFVTALYGLNHIGVGAAFLSYHMVGRPGFKPYLVMQQGKIGSGTDIVKRVGGPAGLVVQLDSAAILQKAGKLTRIIRGPAFPTLEPYEKVWDVIDLRPQLWNFPVKAMTKEGIPVTYEAAMTFQVGDTDEDILKAAACKWIRDDERPDRLMYWVRRVISSATEGTFRKIIAWYSIDDLIDGDAREDMRAELQRQVSASTANGFGVTLLDVRLRDLRFTHDDTEARDKVENSTEALKEWYEQWKNRRKLEIKKIEANRDAEMTKMRVKVESQIRQEIFNGVVEIMNETAAGSDRLSNAYIVLSFIEMLKRITANRNLFLSAAAREMLEDLQGRLNV